MSKTTDPQDKETLLNRLPSLRSGGALLRRIARSKPAQEDKPGAAKTTQELLEKMGDKAEPILYALLCDEQNPLRKTVDEALHGGTKSAIAVLVPLLVAQFALAPAIAVVVAGFVVKTLASKGQEKLCKELSEARAKKDKAKRCSAVKPKTKPRATKSKARRRTTKSAAKE
jgi:hypothetical protein